MYGHPHGRDRNRFSTLAILAGLLGLSWTLLLVPQTTRAAEAVGADAPRVLERIERSNYKWPYAKGPHYGELRENGKRAAGAVRTTVGSFRLDAVAALFPEKLQTTNRLDSLARQYFIVQLDPAAAASGSFTELARVVDENGGARMQSIPVSAQIVRLNAASLTALRRVQGVLAVEPYHPAFKLDPTIGRTPLVDATRALSETYLLDVLLFAGEDPQVAADAISRLDGRILHVRPDTIRVELHRGRLSDLAALEAVYAIFEHVPLRPHGEETTTTVQTGGWNQGATPYHAAGVDGGGGGVAAPQVLMNLDTGIQLDAGDLSDTRVSVGSPGFNVSNARPDFLHRKVSAYETTDQFGGVGDLEGCDSALSGGYTHGHAVAATALGAGTTVGPYYGDPWYGFDRFGNRWQLDGVAPGGLLVAYDGQAVPQFASCDDPQMDTISPGDLYVSPFSGSLGKAYTVHDARVVDFSWGAPGNTYGSHPSDIDNFIFQKRDALVFVSVGNSATDEDPEDGVPDPGSVDTPATAKNGLAIGASGNANDLGAGASAASRAPFSGVGPSVGNRIAPQLMAPGVDFGRTSPGCPGDAPWPCPDAQPADGLSTENMGLDSEFSCRSHDNDSLNPVECDIVSGRSGTSYAAAAAAGAAMLVRDYFAQGFYPDGTSADPGNPSDQVPNISGALVKALLIASAEWMDGENLISEHRFNNEQGYGRIRLDNALPLENWPSSPTGLIVVDGGIDGGVKHITGMTGDLNALTGGIETGTFSICDPSEELRVALAWVEPAGPALNNDLHLELVSPTGKVYQGNYFTDDDNRDGIVDLFNEDCPGVTGSSGELGASRWSQPICVRNNATLPPKDHDNPTEAIMLSPDHDGDGAADPDPVDDDQIETGTWTVRVIAEPGGSTSHQRYALVVVGGVCLESSVSLDSDAYVCSDSAVVAVSEADDAQDPVAGLSPAEISSRVTVELLENGQTVDCEGPGCVPANSGLSFSRPDPLTPRFVSDPLPLTDGTARDPGNGALDLRGGETLRVTYADESLGTTDPVKSRTSLATVDCTTRIGFGDVVVEQFGRDESNFVNGGCERSARGFLEYGHPDRYLDAGERLVYGLVLASREPVEMENATVRLRCVLPDGNSPEDCRTTDDCADPGREDNPDCGWVEILSPFFAVGSIPAGAALSANFEIRMADVIPSDSTVELVAEVTGSTAGKTLHGWAVDRQRLEVDEESLFYSTDFPAGGTEFRDYDNNEYLQNPTTDLNDPALDYRFEQRTYADLSGGGIKNVALGAPWNFDVHDGNFTSGIGAMTTIDTIPITNTIVQWGEDLNFNNILDRFCSVTGAPCQIASHCPLFPTETCELPPEDRRLVDSSLDKSWSTAGGCGWQTKAPGTCSLDPVRGCYTLQDCVDAGAGVCSGPGQSTGGIWHTGRIGSTLSASCSSNDATPAQCWNFGTVSGTTGERLWFELLRTPTIEKVNGDDYTVEIVDWAWNQAVDLPDEFACRTWEFDTDVDALQPVDLVSDLNVHALHCGPEGLIATNAAGYDLFAEMDPAGNSINGVLGDNREGRNACHFAFTQDPSLGGDLAGPPDDDLNNGYCADDPSVACLVVADCTSVGLTGPCLFDNVNIDEYVTTNGPIRNMNISDLFGPDMRFSTLEDIYGDTGERFAAAVGLVTLEAGPLDPTPTPGYGLGIDDMVIEWREFHLVPDLWTCPTGGGCAVLELQTTNVYGGSSLLTITVIDETPSANDCDGNGSNTDPGDDLDCNDDGVLELQVVAGAPTTAPPTPDETVTLNETSTAGVYRGTLPLSASFDRPGVLFLRKSGGVDPTVVVTYFDADDGTTNPCQNHADPALRGEIRAETTIFLETGEIVVTGYALSDNGDLDPYADTHETVEMQIRLRNDTGRNLTGVRAWIRTDDTDKIECVVLPSIEVGPLADGEEKLGNQAFRFKISDVDRTTLGLGPTDPLQARFEVLVSAVEFDTAATRQFVTLALDLDATGGSGPTSYFEGFEAPLGLGSFTAMNLDAGLHGGPESDGYRCQYSDPDNPASNTFGQQQCLLDASAAHADKYYWQVHDPTDIDGGRAYSGLQSLYMGVFGAQADEHTTPFGVLEAVRTQNPINIGLGVCESAPTVACAGDGDCPGLDCVYVMPILSFKHQISFGDYRTVLGLDEREAVDRAVLHVQLADASGTPVGDWIKIYPHYNVYDSRSDEDFAWCFYDPIDDGHDEDDLNPDQRTGPSSTCYDEPVFAYMGDTFWPFSAFRIGQASHGPGLRGSLGIGTWVESKFDLSEFRGQRIRMRFLNAGMNLDGISAETWQEVFFHNPHPGDDGWWIDDVLISDALVSAFILVNDDADNSGLPGCGSVCNDVIPMLGANPAGTLPSPNRPVELSALGSEADPCRDGTPEYRFWLDNDGNGAGDPVTDILLRDWTDDPRYVVIVDGEIEVVLDVRCSADPDCNASTNLFIPVACPGSGSPRIFSTILAPDPSRLTWTPSEDVEFRVGPISDLSTRALSRWGELDDVAFLDISGDNPGAGEGLWYLLRHGDDNEYCNALSTYSSGGPGEQADRCDLTAKRWTFWATVTARDCPPSRTHDVEKSTTSGGTNFVDTGFDLSTDADGNGSVRIPNTMSGTLLKGLNVRWDVHATQVK